MRINFIDNDLMVFLNKEYISEIDFLNKSELEDYFRSLFIKFKNIYDIDISGSYEIYVYSDDNYGVILKLVKDELDYFDYYDGQIDMKIVISKYNKFLYKLNGYVNKNILSNGDVYLYNGDFYIAPNRCDYVNLGLIVENSEIIFGSNVSRVIHEGKCVNIKDYCI